MLDIYVKAVLGKQLHNIPLSTSMLYCMQCMHAYLGRGVIGNILIYVQWSLYFKTTHWMKEICSYMCIASGLKIKV